MTVFLSISLLQSKAALEKPPFVKRKEPPNGNELVPCFSRRLLLLSWREDLCFTTFDARLHAAGWGEKEPVRVKGIVLWDTEASAVMHFLFGSPESQRTPKPELPSSFPSSSYPEFILPGTTYWFSSFWIMVTHHLR